MLKTKVHAPATAEILCHGLCQKLPVEASTPVRINKTTCYVCDWSGTLLRSFLSSLLRAADAFWVTWSVRRNALTEKAWEDAVQGLGKTLCMC